jgi:hypothetical protein
MVSRRKFLGMLAALPAITALAGAGILPPRREDVEVTAYEDPFSPTAYLNQYFTSKDSWFIKMDAQEAQDFRYFCRTTDGRNVPLVEKSLEDTFNQVRANEALPVRPTKLIIPPRLAHTAHYVLTHKPTLFERFMWRLFPN